MYTQTQASSDALSVIENVHGDSLLLFIVWNTFLDTQRADTGTEV